MNEATETVVPETAPEMAGEPAPVEFAPAAPVALTAWQKRRQRQREKERKRAERAANRAAKESNAQGATGGDAAAGERSDPAAAEPVNPVEVRGALVPFVRALWGLAGLVAGLFRCTLDSLTDEEVGRVVDALLPVALRMALLRKLASWVAVPVELVALVARKLHRRQAPEAPKS